MDTQHTPESTPHTPAMHLKPESVPTEPNICTYTTHVLHTQNPHQSRARTHRAHRPQRTLQHLHQKHPRPQKHTA